MKEFQQFKLPAGGIPAFLQNPQPQKKPLEVFVAGRRVTFSGEEIRMIAERADGNIDLWMSFLDAPIEVECDYDVFMNELNVERVFVGRAREG